jgi:hypothetical protein
VPVAVDVGLIEKGVDLRHIDVAVPVVVRDGAPRHAAGPFRVSESGFKVECIGFSVIEFRVQGLGFEDQGSGRQGGRAV